MDPSVLIEISEEQVENFESFKEKGEKNKYHILKILQTKSVYDISRACITGSKGIKSFIGATNQADFDLTFFVNFPGPPFKQVLSNFEKSILKHRCKKHDFYLDQRTNHSFQFKMRDITSDNPKDFLTFEVFVAKNFLTPAEENLLSSETKILLQKDRALKLISTLPDPRKDIWDHSSSLAEAHVAFVESQSPFVKDVVRMAKLWNRKVTWDESEKLIGRSIIIELIAISAARAEEIDAMKARRDGNLLPAVQFFLKKFLNFDRYICELFPFPNNTNLLFPYKEYVDATCSVGGPIILDPVNPFNNYAVNITSEMKCALQKYAMATLRGFKNYPVKSVKNKNYMRSFFGV